MGWIVAGVVIYLVAKLIKLLKHQRGVERVASELKSRGYKVDEYGRIVGKQLSKREEEFLWEIYKRG